MKQPVADEAKKVDNFDVLKRMAAEDKTIMLCPDVLAMNYSEKTKGTIAQVGVPGNPIGDILNGRKRAVLLIWDKAQFDELKARMSETAEPDPPPACAKCAELAKLLVECRDALPAISIVSARLRRIDLNLAERIEAALKPWKVPNDTPGAI